MGVTKGGIVSRIKLEFLGAFFAGSMFFNNFRAVCFIILYWISKGYFVFIHGIASFNYYFLLRNIRLRINITKTTSEHIKQPLLLGAEGLIFYIVKMGSLPRSVKQKEKIKNPCAFPKQPYPLYIKKEKTNARFKF